MRLIQQQRQVRQRLKPGAVLPLGQMQEEPLGLPPLTYGLQQPPGLQDGRVGKGRGLVATLRLAHLHQGGVQRQAQLFGGQLPVIGGLMLRCRLIGGPRPGCIPLGLKGAARPIVSARQADRGASRRFQPGEMAQGGVRIAQPAQRDEAREKLQIHKIAAR